MNLLGESRRRLRWFFRLLETIHRAVGWRLITVIGILILGQLSLILAMLLPLKVILLAAVDGIPWYLDGLITPEIKDQLMIVLVLGAFFAYGISLLSWRISNSMTYAGAKRIHEAGQKLSLFRNDGFLVRQHYSRVCSAIASLMLSVISAGLGFWLAPGVFLVVLSLTLVEYFICAAILAYGGSWDRKLRNSFQENFSRSLDIFANSNFLIGFIFLFTQFLASDDRKAIVVIIALVLLRQMTNRLRLSLTDFITLSSDSHRISPLFHRNVRYKPPADAKREEFIHLMTPVRRKLWIPDAIANVTQRAMPELLECSWNDTFNAGIGALDVRVRKSGGETELLGQQPFDYFLLCFSVANYHEAQHTAYFFESGTSPRIAPRYLGRTVVSGVNVLVFHGLPAVKLTQEAFQQQRMTLQRECESTALGDVLRDDYLRTHRILSQRVDDRLISLLSPTVSKFHEMDNLRIFTTTLPQIVEYIQCLPVVLENPSLSREFCRVDENGQIIVWSWHNWRLDLLGARTLEEIPAEALAVGRTNRIDDMLLAGQSGRRILLSRLTDLEGALQSGRLKHGLRQVADINILWERIAQLRASPPKFG